MSTRAMQFEVLLAGVRDPSTNSPLASGTVTFYSAGTATVKNVWTEKEKTNAYTEYTLDSGGKAHLYGEGEYKIVAKNSAGATIFTWDNYKIEHPNFYPKTITSVSYVATTDDDFIVANTASNNVAITVLAAASWIKPLKIKNISTNVCSVSPASGTIEGESTVYITQNQTRTFFSDGTNIYLDDTNPITDTLGLVVRPKFTYNSTTAIKIGAGAYHHAGTTDQVIKIASELTFTFGPAGSNSASSSLGASEVQYLYLDDSAIVSAGVSTITAALLVAKTTSPTYSHTKGGHYDGLDRCIAGFTTNGSSQIEIFWHDGGNNLQYDNYKADFAAYAPGQTWTNVTSSVPTFCERAMCTVELEYVDASQSGYYRAGGSSATTGHLLGTVNSASVTKTARISPFLDGTLRFQVRFTTSDNNTIAVWTDGWYFPKGM